MEEEDVDPTQPTQAMFDPRREGRQNSGFTDEEISDIMCILIPASAGAACEVANMVKLNLPYISIKSDDSHHDTNEFGLYAATRGYRIILRLSDAVKNPRRGFVFGRNFHACDICFVHDPFKRVSNSHFRIYVNQWGHIMLESKSTNGTQVDDRILFKDGEECTRMLITGARIRILMHESEHNIDFLVRIPQRHGAYADAYMANVDAHIRRHSGVKDTTVAPDVNGKIDAFRTPACLLARTPTTKKPTTPMPQEWTGHPDYHKVGPIGRGAFASVYLVTRRMDGRPFAAKELDTLRFLKNGVLDARVDNELQIMRSVQHPNIVQFIEHFLWDKLMIIIMELVSEGDVGRHITEHGLMDESLSKSLAMQMLDAVSYLHGLGITHRDIKPDNILIQSTDPPLFKLSDFGLSKMVTNEGTFLRTFCGTLLYCAPEVYAEFSEYDEHGLRSLPRTRHVTRPRYGHLIDIWSLGAVLYYCLSGQPPFPAANLSHTEFLHRIMTKDLDVGPLRHQKVTDSALNFMRLMLQRRPENRADISTLRRHRWLDGYKTSDEKEEEQLQVGASQLSLEDGKTFFAEKGGNNDKNAKMYDSEYDSMLSQDRISDESGLDSTPQRALTVMMGSQDLGPIVFGGRNISTIDDSFDDDENKDDDNDLEVISAPIDDDAAPEGDDSDLADYTIVRPLVSRSQLKPPISRAQSVDQLPGLVQEISFQNLNNKDMVADGNSSLGLVSGQVHSINNTSIRRRSTHYDDDKSIAEVECLQKNLSGDRTPHQSDARLGFTAEYNASKRKDPYDDASQEDLSDAELRSPQSTIKRIKANAPAELLSEEQLKECRLMVRVPPICTSTRRLIDDPVSKITYWDDSQLSTWHCNYPEMTQLQYDAFLTAAKESSHEFGPGKSPYWDLAMKYFPPSQTVPAAVGADLQVVSPSVSVDFFQSSGQTLGTGSEQSAAAITDANQQPLAWFGSTQDSVVGNIGVALYDSMISWGRGPENTEIYRSNGENRIPKYGFRILLWREGYDAALVSSRTPTPWSNPCTDADTYAFFIATKATKGISVNNFMLESRDTQRPLSPAVNWVQLYDGDVICVWGSPGVSLEHTTVMFRCRWGGSSKPRPADVPPTLVPETVSRKLDAIFYKKSCRIRMWRDVKRRQDEVHADMERRRASVELERERSRIFRERCREAAVYLGIPPPESRFDSITLLTSVMAANPRSTTI